MVRVLNIAVLSCLLSLTHSFCAFSADKSGAKVILFLGNSLTAGSGLDSGQAFPALIQEKIDSRGWNFSVINGGQSGETSAGGLRRLGWFFKRNIDVLVLELGANDGLRGFNVEGTKANLQAIIDRTKKKYPNVQVVLAGMQLPPNLGPEYAAKFRAIFFDLTNKNKTSLIPFLLEGVGGVPRLNFPDGIHPNAEGHKILAENVWNVLEPLLRSK